jgi:hypothetical protein
MDIQQTGEQGVTVEDSMSMVHLSFGMKKPASRQLKSECAILAGMARATLPDFATPWEHYVDDYDRIRDTMAKVFDGFEDFNRRGRLPLDSGSGSPRASPSSSPLRSMSVSYAWCAPVTGA